MLRNSPGPFFLLAGIGFLLPCILVSLIHALVLGRRRTKQDSLREGINAAIIITVTTVLVVLWVIPLACNFSTGVCQSPISDELAVAATALWFVITAYLYQYDYLVRSRRAKSKPKHTPIDSAKHPNSSANPVVDPIEAELNEMKKQHGMKKRKH